MPKKEEVLNTVPVDIPKPKSNGNGNKRDEEQDDTSSREKARVILVNQITNTPKEKMVESTVIPRRMVAVLSASKTITEIPRMGELENPFMYWQDCFFQAMRSVGGFHMKNMVMLAENQLTEENNGAIEDDTP
jgi:hypothetical protein